MKVVQAKRAGLACKIGKGGMSTGRRLFIVQDFGQSWEPLLLELSWKKRLEEL